jgi:O-antigen/teichoic acid export membrane protein
MKQAFYQPDQGVNLRRGFVASSVLGLLIRGVEVAAKLALYMLAGRLLSLSQSGWLFLGMTWAVLASTVARMGVEKALSRLVAAELALGQGLSAGRAIIRGSLTSLALGLLIGALTFFTAPLSATLLFHDPQSEPALRSLALLIPAFSLATTLAYVLVGLHRTLLSQVLLNLSWPIGMLLALLCGASRASQLLMIMSATQFAAAAVSLMVIFLDRAQLTEDQPLPAGASPLPGLFATAWPLYAVELVQVSINSLPTLALGVFADPRSVSIYSIAQRAATLVAAVLLSLATLASPRFAALQRVGDWAELASVNRRTQGAGFLVGGAICLVLGIGAGPVLGLIGPTYTEGATILVIMLIGQAFAALYTAQDGFLAMTGQGSALRALNLAQFVVMLSLGLLLVPRHGILGTAIVTAIVTAQGGIGTAMAVKTFFPNAAPFLVFPVPSPLRRFFLRLAA